jgi:hypothetical protein
LAESITNKKDYNKELRTVKRDLLIHLKMRKIMDKFSLKDWNYLIKLFSKDKTKKILESNDRDFPSKFLVNLALTEPRLLYFLKYIF